ncbi:MAG TPA: M20/M25/M40 family metallo-hydrolase, partial [Rhodospirillales bacterium]
KDGKLYGRGTADMKTFIAIVLAFAPRMLKKGLKTPVHLAFSYDEEVGCIGVRRLIEKLKDMPVKPAICIVGEPTGMQVVTGHKGKRSYVAKFRGLEAHSALAPQGVNAIEYAAELITFLKGMARKKQADGPHDSLYDITHTTVHTGMIAGGTQLNIVPKSCRVEFEFRYIGDDDPDKLEAEIRAYAKDRIEPGMRAVSPEAGVDIDPNAEVVAFVKALAGRNDHAKVAFGTEAGLFQSRADIPTVVCGPGAIAQAHKPNEFISAEQVLKGEEFMKRLTEKVCKG